VLGAILAGILKHPHGELDLVSVLEAVKDQLNGNQQPLTSDPIDVIIQKTTELSESFIIGEDFQLLGASVVDMIGNTARACIYIKHVIVPLWARKSRGREVRQSDIDKCLWDFDSNSDLYN
jgi:hypothetical protein